MTDRLYIYGYVAGYLRKQAGTSYATAASEMNTQSDVLAPASPAPDRPFSDPAAVNRSQRKQPLRGSETGQYLNPRRVVHQTMSPANMDTIASPDSPPLGAASTEQV